MSRTPFPLGTAKIGRNRKRVHALRSCALLIAVVSAAACASNGAHQAPNPSMIVAQPSPTQATLRDALLAMKTGIPSHSDQVLKFYQSRNFMPAWYGTVENEAMGAEIRAVLGRAHEQGLRDEDYKLSQTQSHRAPGAEAAEYDLALTDSLLRYSHDVRTGRVRPGDIYDDVILTTASFDAVSDLTAAMGAGSVANFLADLPPHHPEYRQLAKALAAYRAIADDGGWPSLPGQNEIKIDGKDARLKGLIKRLAVEDPILAAAPNPSNAEIREAVNRFQTRNGLEEDGRVGGETLAALDIPVAFRIGQISANMERWRWMQADFENRYIAVNVPDQSLSFVRDGTATLSSRVIVGRKSSPTPITRTAILAIIANPPWNIPGDIAARDLLPHLRKSPNYLAAKHMVVTDGPPGDPYGRTIKWANIVPAEFPYAIRQLPGPNTALGSLMLDSPNDFDVYLHDTPNKKRFESEEREISNGCVRVQQILPLASLALTDDPAKGTEMLKHAIKTRETQRLALDNALPVYFLYWTALAGPDGTVGFRPDRYGRDAPLIAALTKGPSAMAATENQRSPRPDPDSQHMDELSP